MNTWQPMFLFFGRPSTCRLKCSARHMLLSDGRFCDVTPGVSQVQTPQRAVTAYEQSSSTAATTPSTNRHHCLLLSPV